MEHIYEKHDACEVQNCPICDGGLLHCTVCGGFEGSLTTDCCGRKITVEEVDRIYKLQNLDFITLGRVAESVLTKLGHKTIYVPHPSPQNLARLGSKGKEIWQEKFFAALN